MSLFPYVSFMSIFLCLSVILLKKGFHSSAYMSEKKTSKRKNLISTPKFWEGNKCEKQDKPENIIMSKVDKVSVLDFAQLPNVSEAIPLKKLSYQSQVRKISKELRERKKDLESFSMTIPLENLSSLQEITKYLKEIQDILSELRKMSGFEGSHDTEAVMVMEVKLPRLLERAEDLESRIHKALCCQ